MYQKIANLNDREKKLISLAGILILIMGIYLIFTKIPNLFGSSMGSVVTANTKKLNILLPKIEKLKQLKDQVHVYRKIPNNNLYEFINNNKPELLVLGEEEPEIINQNNGQQVLIKYKAVGFDDFIKWLEDLHLKYGMVIEKADITPKEKPGYVSVEVLIKAQPA